MQAYALMLLEGRGTYQDTTQAAEYLERLAESDQGTFPHAMFLLGIMLVKVKVLWRKSVGRLRAASSCNAECVCCSGLS